MPLQKIPSGTDLYTNFIDCCTQCAVDSPDNGEESTACCAACPNPIDYLLFWAEHSDETQQSCDDKTAATSCMTAKGNTASTFAGNDKGDHYKPMCDTLQANVPCDAGKLKEAPYDDFKECCQKCQANNAEPDKQMECVHDDNCGAPPTTHTTGHTTEKQTTAKPGPPPPPAPTTTTTVIPKTTTETEGEESDGNGTGPTERPSKKK
jgi:hypothetical protein